MVSDDMRENVDEARDKIMTAFELKDDCPQAALWYRDMAAAHIAFNTNGHAVVTKMISDYRASDAYREHPEYADGMMDAWNAIHADVVKKTAEVQAMISTFK